MVTFLVLQNCDFIGFSALFYNIIGKLFQEPPSPTQFLLLTNTNLMLQCYSVYIIFPLALFPAPCLPAFIQTIINYFAHFAKVQMLCKAVTISASISTLKGHRILETKRQNYPKSID